jgi:hypothetical protein
MNQTFEANIKQLQKWHFLQSSYNDYSTMGRSAAASVV